MNHEAYRYFIATGRPLEAINAWQAHTRLRVKAQERFRKSIKAEGLLFVYSTEGTQVVVGAVFKNDPGEPWRHYKKDLAHYYRPNKSTSKGRALHAQLLDLSQPSTIDMVKAWGAKHPLTFCKDARVRHSGFEVMDGKYIVHVPKEAKDFKPAKGLKEIPLSKFFALKEKKAAKKAA